MPKSKFSTAIFVLILITLAILGALRFIDQQKGRQVVTRVACISPAIPGLSRHYHPHLTIVVDGNNVVIPAEIGLSPTCERELHTHDPSGTIHLESQNMIPYTLQDFFDVWGQKLEKRGYRIGMSVNGQVSNAFGQLELKEGQNIVLTYNKVL